MLFTIAFLSIHGEVTFFSLQVLKTIGFSENSKDALMCIAEYLFFSVVCL